MGIIGFVQEFIKLMDPMLILVMLGSTVRFQEALLLPFYWVRSCSTTSVPGR